MVLVAKGITCTDILETYTCTYIAATDKLLGVLLVGVHLEQTAHTFLLSGTGIEDI